MIIGDTKILLSCSRSFSSRSVKPKESLNPSPNPEYTRMINKKNKQGYELNLYCK